MSKEYTQSIRRKIALDNYNDYRSSGSGCLVWVVVGVALLLKIIL